MKNTLVFSVLTLAVCSAWATNSHTGPSVNQNQNQTQQQGNQQGVYAGDNNLYVLPAPVSAANLPPGLCPQGDSLSWSIGWNFFSYARSSTRTEMECLDKVALILKANPAPAPAVLQGNPHPVCVYIEQPPVAKQLAHKITQPVKKQLQCN